MRAGVVLLTVSVMTALLCGCEVTPARYKVLSFFFDGVPNPEAKQQMAKEAGRNAAGAVSKGSVHGPYAARQCGACHKGGTNAPVLPLRELCFQCHQFKMDKKWVHGPLAAGGCLLCHNPHSSAYPFLLASESEDFCFSCHDEKALKAKEPHKDINVKCTSCHDAHMSDKKYLLK